jgi:hypothetical protein
MSKLLTDGLGRRHRMGWYASNSLRIFCTSFDKISYFTIDFHEILYLLLCQGSSSMGECYATEYLVTFNENL